ncbi:MAG: hypothetical protein EB103_06430 [Actinobacteria bacterium]|nr:hypothetical protein [Actinomycetota bacterium]
MDINSRLPSIFERNLKTMPIWEYTVTPLPPHNPKQILDHWGQQGWELVQIVPTPEGGYVAYMKRVKE